MAGSEEEWEGQGLSPALSPPPQESRAQELELQLITAQTDSKALQKRIDTLHGVLKEHTYSGSDEEYIPGVSLGEAVSSSGSSYRIGQFDSEGSSGALSDIELSLGQKKRMGRGRQRGNRRLSPVPVSTRRSQDRDEDTGRHSDEEGVVRRRGRGVSPREEGRGRGSTSLKRGRLLSPRDEGRGRGSDSGASLERRGERSSGHEATPERSVAKETVTVVSSEEEEKVAPPSSRRKYSFSEDDEDDQEIAAILARAKRRDLGGGASLAAPPSSAGRRRIVLSNSEEEETMPSRPRASEEATPTQTRQRENGSETQPLSPETTPDHHHAQHAAAARRRRQRRRTVEAEKSKKVGAAGESQANGHEGSML